MSGSSLTLGRKGVPPFRNAIPRGVAAPLPHAVPSGLARRLAVVTCTALVACREPNGTPAGSVALDLVPDPDLPMRAVASWDADAAPRAWVRFGDGRVTPASTTGTIPLLGMPADTEIVAELVTEAGVVGEAPFHTGPAPDGLPTLDVEGEIDAGYLVVSTTPLPGTPPALYVLDRHGAIVDARSFAAWGTPRAGQPSGWGVQVEPGAAWIQLSTAAYSGALRVDWEGPIDATPESAVESGAWVELPGAHHDLCRLPDGTLAYLRAETRTIEGEAITGDLLVVRSPDGTERIVWDAFATRPLERHDAWALFPDTPGDWTHGNGVTWDPEARRWAVSLYWLREIVVVDDATGAVVQVLEGDSASAPFGPQHAVRWKDDGWWMFDNADRTRGSTAVQISPAGEVLARWSPPTMLWGGLLGDVAPLDDGRVLVGGGVLPTTWLGRPDAAPAFVVNWPPGTLVGQQHLVESLYAEPLAE